MTAGARTADVSDWPESELDYLGRCPLCASHRREIIYDRLQDRVFFCASGFWTLWRCLDCDVSYLDPVIKPEFIHKAYSSYYTHDTLTETGSRTLKSRVRQGVENSQLNRMYATEIAPSIPGGWLAYRFLPAALGELKNRVRDLPKPTGKDARLLDIGCGNGSFLRVARRLGYLSEGLEVDPAARKVAAEHGLDVHPGPWPGSGLAAGSYDQITMNHVIEHLHDPKLALEEAYRLLKPGGRMWAQTPNIRATSLKRFKQNSRLLEPPRHVVLFSHDAMERLLHSVGFRGIRVIFDKSVAQRDFDYTVAQSWMMENELDPYNTSYDLVPQDVKADTLTFGDTSQEEYKRADTITVVADKPAL